MTVLSGLLNRRGMTGVTLLQAAALAPPLAVAVAERGFPVVQVLVAAAVVALAWEAVFATVRRQPLGFAGLTTAIIVAVFAGPDVPFWPLAVTLSLGVVVGELIFGGRGFGFVNAGAVSLALLGLSVPGLALAVPSAALALACLPGAVLLVATGLLNWRVLIAVPAGVLAAAALADMPVDPVGLAIGLSFGLVFLFGDPLAGAVTAPGRWVYGVLAGALVVLFSGTADGIAPGAIVSASVLASVFAPTIDHLAVLAAERLRERRHV